MQLIRYQCLAVIDGLANALNLLLQIACQLKLKTLEFPLFIRAGTDDPIYCPCHIKKVSCKIKILPA